MAGGTRVGTIFAEVGLDYEPFTRAQKTLLKDATSTTTNIEKNFKNLGIKSAQEFDLMRAKISNSYNMIANSAKATASDIIRAEQAKNDQLKRLNDQQFGHQTSMISKLRASWLGYTAGLYVVQRAMRSLLGAAIEQEAVEAKLSAVIKATGGAAGLTAQQMLAMAGGLQKVTGVGDEIIIQGQAVLATFKNIRGEGFERATKAALDMSEVMKSDLQSSIVMIGKAMNDPIANLSAMSRAGVQFTEAQKDMVKALWEAGDKMAAQQIILKELESQFGGSAQAAMETFGRSADAAKNIFGDFVEMIGEFITKSPDAVKAFRTWADGISTITEKLRKFREEWYNNPEIKAANILQSGGSVADIMSALGYGTQSGKVIEAEGYVEIYKKKPAEQAAATVELEKKTSDEILKLHAKRLDDEAALYIKYLQEMGKRRAQEEKDAAEEALRVSKETVQKIDDSYQHMLDNIHDSTSDVFYDIFTGTIRGWEDLMDRMGDYFARLLADMAAQAIMQPIIVPMVASMFGGGGSVPGYSGSSAMGAINTAGSISSIAKWSSKIGSFLNTPLGSLTTSASGIPWGASVGEFGAVEGGMSGMFGTTTVGQAMLPIAALALWGKATDWWGLTDPKAQYANIGKVKGGWTPGKGFGVPGGFQSGGNFGNETAVALTTAAEGIFDNFNTQMGAYIDNASPVVTQQFIAGLKQMKVEFGDAGKSSSWAISDNKTYKIEFEGVLKTIQERVFSAADAIAQGLNFKDVAELMKYGGTFTAQRALKGASGLNYATQYLYEDIAAKYNVAGGAQALIGADMDAFMEWFADPANINAINDALDELGFTFDEVRDDALALKTAMKALDDATTGRLTSLQGQLQAQMFVAGGGSMSDWYMGQYAMLLGIIQSGGGTTEDLITLSGYAEKWFVSAASESEEIAGNMSRAADASKRITDQIDTTVMGLKYGSTTSPYLPSMRFSMATGDFYSIYQKALGGDQAAIQQFSSFAPEYLSLAKDVYKSGAGYTDIFNKVIAGFGNIRQTVESVAWQESFVNDLKGPAGADLSTINTTLTTMIGTIGGLKVGALTNTIGGASAVGANAALSSPDYINITAGGQNYILGYSQAAGIYNTYQSMSQAERDLWLQTNMPGMSPSELAVAMGSIKTKFGFQYGGLSTGPESGYVAKLHGTEMIVSPQGPGVPATVQGNQGEVVAELKKQNQILLQLLAASAGGNGKVVMVINGKPIELEIKKIADAVVAERDNNPSLKGRYRYY